MWLVFRMCGVWQRGFVVMCAWQRVSLLSPAAACLQDTNSIVSTLEFGIGLAINIMFMLMYLAVWKIDV